MSFLFFVFLIGIFIATLQDLKRREVDNWLNALLLVVGIVYLFYSRSSLWIFNICLVFISTFLVSNLFYYGRVFAGGDAKLLFAMTPLFISGTFYSTLLNFGAFLILLMISGSVYGLGYSFFIYFRNKKEVNKDFRKRFNKKFFLYSFLISISFFIFSISNPVFLLLAILILTLPLLFTLSKSLEAVAMVKKVGGKFLTEGDWLVKDVRLGRKVIRANWEGLTKNEIRLLRSKKEVLIKDGIPFVPAFLIAFVSYYLFKDLIFGLFLI